MIDALFIWNCGEETVNRVENNADRWEIEMSLVRSAKNVLFVRCDQRRQCPDKPTESMPIFKSYSGEEPWMALPLKRHRLRDELYKVEQQMIAEGLL